MNEMIFKATTKQGFVVKVLCDLLQNNLKQCCFRVNNKGIVLKMTDYHRKVFIHLQLQASGFDNYVYNHPEDEFIIGINTSNLYKLLKSIKKKDAFMSFYIEKSDPSNLAVEVRPANNNKITTSRIKLQNIQSVDIDPPDGYGKPIIIEPSEYQKLCKDMKVIGSTIKLVSNNDKITFKCDNSVFSREATFGNIDDNSLQKEFIQEYDVELLMRFTKLSGLSKSMELYSGDLDNPLQIKTTIGKPSIGIISIFIKSVEQINTENSE